MVKAEKYGSGWVSVCNTNHFGIAGYYPLKALEKDLIGWTMTKWRQLETLRAALCVEPRDSRTRRRERHRPLFRRHADRRLYRQR
ncbi:MAG TPA: Ldh family oxidoreductase [Candidatus Acidoferrales bacterium]|nr:Ldh family oxidoreductase [Candidatus Acidoferrales bacterium]